MRYAKIFDSLWEGSMRGKSDPLFVFVNLLTHSDEHGIVDRHWRAIADETGLPEDRIKAALAFLEQPDSESRTPDEDGKRIVPLDSRRTWGWRIVNHSKYRELCSKTQNAERQARFRDRNASVTHSNKQAVGVGVGDVVIQEGIQGGKGISPPLNPTLKGEKVKPSVRNPVIDALAELHGPLDQITSTTYRQIGIALKEIHSVAPNVTPTEIRQRAANYRRKWPNVTCSSSALAKHWGELGSGVSVNVAPLGYVSGGWTDPNLTAEQRAEMMQRRMT